MLSRLPNTQLCLDYLALYPAYRKDGRASALNQLKHNFEYAASYFTSVEPVDDQLDKMVKEAETEIINAKEWTDWYKLITLFREKAEVAKSLKIKKGGESALYETFHGLANLIISELRECKFSQDTEDYNLLDKKINDLKYDLKDTVNKETQCIYTKKGKGTEEANKKEYQIITELAYLGDLESINVARKYRLLDHLSLPTSTEAQRYACTEHVNYAAPLPLQEKYYEWVYAIHFQSIGGISFNEFRIKSIRKEQSKLESDIEMEKRKQEALQEALQKVKAAELEKLRLQEEIEKQKKAMEEEIAKQKKDIKEEQKQILKEPVDLSDADISKKDNLNKAPLLQNFGTFTSPPQDNKDEKEKKFNKNNDQHLSNSM
ncbi:MAG: hypothetical protein KIT56_10155 [Gammaproteobacteria bacterium]|nr:hypothetical protein [Gammaproteobacteria bacterium]MCW5584212.1 hypothetical protein [Gammaproteobacteria bacterium]